MSNLLFYIIVGLFITDFVFEKILQYLNSTRWSNELPSEVNGIYSNDKYVKSQLYEKENFRFSMISSSYSFLLMLLMFLLAGFARLNDFVVLISGNQIIVSLFFFGILLFVFDIISLPFSVYDTFWIEEKYGFNKTSPKTFILDKIKGYFLASIFGGGLLALIIYFYQLATTNFWIYAWILISGFSFFMLLFYSNVIVPLFNKQSLLDDGELKTAIHELSEKAGFELDNIYIIDGSKRSTKANAYFTGIGSKKRIVLYDTLVNDLTTNEIVAVLAHEIGHYKKKHVVWSLITGILQTGLMLFVFSLVIDNLYLSAALGVDKPMFHIGLISFGILYSPISFITGIISNIISRKNEYEADNYAAELFSSKELSLALIKLSVKNLSNLRPHPAYVFFNYSHPTLLQRLNNLKISN